MTAPATFTQWSTIVPFLGTALPGWVPPADQQRIASYLKYEEIYWTSEQGFEAVLRGDNENPVQMPTARTLCDTVNRYTAPQMGLVIESADASAKQIAETAFAILFKRERFTSQFNGAKARWIRQGDWLWHIIADPAKPAGKRLSLTTVDPGAYFPVYEADVVQGGDPDKIVTVHLAEQVVVGSDTLVSRLTYEKVVDETGTATIFRSHGLFKLDKWWQATQPFRIILTREALPAQITNIPVYHLKNMDDTMPFGSSEMRGLESALLALNQTMSDEDMTLALEGLGVWATDGGAPLDEQGRETEWVMGPGRVLTNANGLKKLTGTTSVTPYGDHYDRLLTAVRQAVGASDAAVGRVDAVTAESGVALLLQLGPIMAYTAEKDQTIKDVHTQLFYDLCYWMAVFEELTPLLTTAAGGPPVPSVIITPVFGQKLPVNVKEIVARVVALRSLVPPAISLTTAHAWLRDAGLELQDNELELIAQEQQGVLNALGSTAAADLTDEQRAAQELQDIVP